MNKDRRNWIVATAAVGGVGAAAVALPFVSTFQPSERAKAAGAAVEVDISGIKPGEKITVEWRGKPVWIVKRTPEQLASLPKDDALLADPKSERKADELTPAYARNENRSIKPELLVLTAAAGRRLVRIQGGEGCEPGSSYRFTFLTSDANGLAGVLDLARGLLTEGRSAERQRVLELAANAFPDSAQALELRQLLR